MSLEVSLPYLLQMHGWCTEDKMQHLYKLVHDFATEQPEVAPFSVELGVFAGRSALPIAIAHKDLGRGSLIGIDAWSIDATKEGQNSSENDEWWEKNSQLEKMEEYFNTSIETLQLTGWVMPVKGKSENLVGSITDNIITLLHIDGNHSEEKSCLDVTLWLPKVVAGGYVVLDDTGWDTVKKAYGMLKETCELVFEKEGENSYTVFKKK